MHAYTRTGIHSHTAYGRTRGTRLPNTATLRRHHVHVADGRRHHAGGGNRAFTKTFSSNVFDHEQRVIGTAASAAMMETEGISEPEPEPEPEPPAAPTLRQRLRTEPVPATVASRAASEGALLVNQNAASPMASASAGDEGGGTTLTKTRSQSYGSLTDLLLRGGDDTFVRTVLASASYAHIRALRSKHAPCSCWLRRRRTSENSSEHILVCRSWRGQRLNGPDLQLPVIAACHCTARLTALGHPQPCTRRPLADHCAPTDKSPHFQQQLHWLIASRRVMCLDARRRARAHPR